MRQIFLDTETTGLDPAAGDRVVEIGCIEMVNRRLTGRRLHLYLNPERQGSGEAIRIHGLTDEFLADKPRFGEVAEELTEFLRDAEVVIHNAAFDLGFLDAELARIGRAPLRGVVHRVVDTLALAREAYPGKANSLDALCRRLEVDNSQRTLHGALLDAGLLAEVYIRLTRGQDSLIIQPHGEAGGADTQAEAPIDLTRFALPVIEPDEAELAAHEAVLRELDRTSGGRTVWRSAMAE